MIFIIALTAIGFYQTVLDGFLHPTWHIMVDGSKPNGHMKRFVALEHRTLLVLCSRVAQVDAGDNQVVSGGISRQQRTQTVCS